MCQRVDHVLSFPLTLLHLCGYNMTINILKDFINQIPSMYTNVNLSLTDRELYIMYFKKFHNLLTSLIMIEFKLTVSLIWLIIWPATYVFPKRKNHTPYILHGTGEIIAEDDMVQRYEKEHKKLCENEVKNGDHLEWPALYGKNLLDYCRKYLQECAPKQNTNNINGIMEKKMLHYEKKNTSITNEVVVVQCTVSNKSHKNSYYMTRAPNANCVYALKSAGKLTNFTLTIINKYCDFEDKQLIQRSQKQKRRNIVREIHYKTRQPIAKNEYLLEYELEHQKLLRRGGDNGNCVTWPHILLHSSLDSYCYSYLGKCVPGRKRANVTGKYQTDLLYYRKLKTKRNVIVTTVSCVLGDAPKLYYYITRALETHCVYALLRYGHNGYASLVIIFKYCDFEVTNDQKTISNVYNVISKDVIVKTDVKEEKMIH